MLCFPKPGTTPNHNLAILKLPMSMHYFKITGHYFRITGKKTMLLEMSKCTGNIVLGFFFVVFLFLFCFVVFFFVCFFFFGGGGGGVLCFLCCVLNRQLRAHVFFKIKTVKIKISLSGSPDRPMSSEGTS